MSNLENDYEKLTETIGNGFLIWQINAIKKYVKETYIGLNKKGYYLYFKVGNLEFKLLDRHGAVKYADKQDALAYNLSPYTPTIPVIYHKPKIKLTVNIATELVSPVNWRFDGHKFTKEVGDILNLSIKIDKNKGGFGLLTIEGTDKILGEHSFSLDTDDEQVPWTFLLQEGLIKLKEVLNENKLAYNEPKISPLALYQVKRPVCHANSSVYQSMCTIKVLEKLIDVIITITINNVGLIKTTIIGVTDLQELDQVMPMYIKQSYTDHISVREVVGNLLLSLDRAYQHVMKIEDQAKIVT